MPRCCRPPEDVCPRSIITNERFSHMAFTMRVYGTRRGHLETHSGAPGPAGVSGRPRGGGLAPWELVGFPGHSRGPLGFILRAFWPALTLPCAASEPFAMDRGPVLGALKPQGRLYDAYP
eukprot:2676950-Pyramimonas_sp.AAC.1